MTTNAARWDDRYAQPGYWAGTQPAEFLLEVLPLLPRGKALDVACGEGRNAVFLASQGWTVLAVDRSQPALDKAEALARDRGVAVSWSRSPLRPESRKSHLALLKADLESIRLPIRMFDLVTCFNYLQRPLMPLLVQTLRPGGMLVYETYTVAHREFAESPREPEFLLRPGELLDAFRGLEVWFYREWTAGKGIASLLAQKCSEGKSKER
jgi:SAM-dependent methyltransferase